MHRDKEDPVKVFIKPNDNPFYVYKCSCSLSYTNFCSYPLGNTNCHMTMPGGYCDPNRNGRTDDADWVRGYSEYQEYCKSQTSQFSANHLYSN